MVTNKSENTEIKTNGKAGKSLPIVLSKKARKNLVTLQSAYMKKYGEFINRKKLGNKIFENATPEMI